MFWGDKRWQTVAFHILVNLVSFPEGKAEGYTFNNAGECSLEEPLVLRLKRQQINTCSATFRHLSLRVLAKQQKSCKRSVNCIRLWHLWIGQRDLCGAQTLGSPDAETSCYSDALSRWDRHRYSNHNLGRFTLRYTCQYSSTRLSYS